MRFTKLPALYDDNTCYRKHREPDKDSEMMFHKEEEGELKTYFLTILMHQNLFT